MGVRGEGADSPQTQTAAATRLPDRRCYSGTGRRQDKGRTNCRQHGVSWKEDEDFGHCLLFRLCRSFYLEEDPSTECRVRINLPERGDEFEFIL